MCELWDPNGVWAYRKILVLKTQSLRKKEEKSLGRRGIINTILGERNWLLYEYSAVSYYHTHIYCHNRYL